VSPKGIFGQGELPSSDKYVYPPSRNRLVLIGLGAALGAGLLIWGAVTFLGAAAIITGPVSSAHANLANQCESCHSEGATVSNEKCAACHEEQADSIGIYALTSHYVYRSADYRRAAARDGEPTCGGCHKEHRGRTAPLTDVSDPQCVACHGVAHEDAQVRHPAVRAFDAKNHPDFEVVKRTEDGGLRFMHDLHVREIEKHERLDSNERACLYCHNPRPGGADFFPISYARHCAACHLKADGTEWVRVVSSIDPQHPGVMTPQAIGALREPGTLWTRSTGPLDFQNQPGEIRKRAVVHRDPWVLFNLRRLRDARYRTGPLADLLEATPEVPPADARVLYEEALQTLRTQASELESSPNLLLRQDLKTIQSRLGEIERRLNDPTTPLPVEPFAVDAHARRAMPATTSADFDSVASRLTRPCQTCHEVRNTAIARVASDQRVMRRAKFDHRKHLVQRRCLDCHRRIPIRAVADSSHATPSERDMASIQNLPSMSTCVTCHTRGKASTECVMCHDFHPKKTRPSEIPLVLE